MLLLVSHSPVSARHVVGAHGTLVNWMNKGMNEPFLWPCNMGCSVQYSGNRAGSAFSVELYSITLKNCKSVSPFYSPPIRLFADVELQGIRTGTVRKLGFPSWPRQIISLSPKSGLTFCPCQISSLWFCSHCQGMLKANPWHLTTFKSHQLYVTHTLGKYDLYVYFQFSYKQKHTGQGLQQNAAGLCKRRLSAWTWSNLVSLCTMMLKHMKLLLTSGPLHLYLLPLGKLSPDTLSWYSRLGSKVTSSERSSCHPI